MRRVEDRSDAPLVARPTDVPVVERLDEVDYLRAIMGATHELVYVCSEDYRVEYMNAAMIRRTGHDATGEQCYRALHDRDDVCPWCVNAIVQQGRSHDWEVTSPKDGRTFAIANSPMVKPDGTIAKVAIIRDVTEARRTAAALATSQQRLALLLDALPFAVGELDARERFVHANRALVESLGDPRGEILGRTALEVLGGPSYRRLQPVLAAALQGQPASLDLPVGDRAVPLRLSLLPHPAPDGRPQVMLLGSKPSSTRS